MSARKLTARLSLAIPVLGLVGLLGLASGCAFDATDESGVSEDVGTVEADLASGHPDPAGDPADQADGEDDPADRAADPEPDPWHPGHVAEDPEPDPWSPPSDPEADPEPDPWKRPVSCSFGPTQPSSDNR